MAYLKMFYSLVLKQIASVFSNAITNFLTRYVIYFLLYVIKQSYFIFCIVVLICIVLLFVLVCLFWGLF